MGTFAEVAKALTLYTRKLRTEEEKNDALSVAWEFWEQKPGAPARGIAYFAVLRVKRQGVFGRSLRSIELAGLRGIGPKRSELDVADLGSDKDNPADRALFNLFFVEWEERLSPREHEAMELLAVGNTPSEVAELLGVGRSRVSQLREALAMKW